MTRALADEEPQSFTSAPYLPSYDVRVVNRGGVWRLDNGYCPGTRVISYFAGKVPDKTATCYANEVSVPVVVGRMAAQPRRRHGEQRPHPLAAGADQMVGELGDQRHRRAHAGQDLAIDPHHVLGAQRQQRLQAGRLALAFEGNDRCHDERIIRPGAAMLRHDV